MRRSIHALALLATVSCGSEAAAPEVTPETDVAGSPARWVEVRSPEDASLVEAPGVVRAPRADAAVASLVPVQVMALHVAPGATVAAGDPIVDVTAPELLRAAADYLAHGAQARAERSRASELERLEGEGLARRADVFARQREARTAGASRDRALGTLRAVGLDPAGARALRRDGYVSLRAPIAGVVVAVSARVGEVRAPSEEPLARIRGEAEARVEVRTPEPWPDGRDVVFEAVDGRLVSLASPTQARSIDPHDGTTLSWYAPAEPTPLPDGLTGTVRLTASDDVWQVPIGAVAQRTGQSAVLRLRGEQRERVEVVVLGTSGASALVRGPLEAGDRVAADLEAVEAP